MATDTGFGKVKWFEDFLGPALDATNDHSDGTENSGTAAANAQEGGVMRLTTGATDGNRIAVGYGLRWQAEGGGPLVMEARIKSVTAITARAYFVGFTDTMPETTLENPIEQSGTTLTTTTTDGCGFMYDTESTNDTWYLVGVANGTDAVSVNTGDAPAAAATYETLRVVVDPDGNATFYKDGKYMGKVSNAVTATVSLTPVVVIETRSAAAISVDCDYIYCEGGRV